MKDSRKFNRTHLFDSLFTELQLAFVAYPQVFSYESLPHFWCGIFYVTIFTLGIENCLVAMETIVDNIYIRFRIPSRYEELLKGVCIASMYLVGFSMTTPGSNYIIKLLSYYCYGWNTIYGLFLLNISVQFYGEL